MIEVTLIDYISRGLDVPCFAEEPAKPPRTYCIIERTGTSERDCITSATVAIQSYGGTLLEAMELNERLLKLMRRMPERDDISRCALVSSYPFNDTTTKRYRFQAVYEITYFEE